MKKTIVLRLAALMFAAAFAFAPAFPATAADDSTYTVRSEPFADRAAALKLSSELAARGYHPVIESGRATEGEYYFLQMGTFANMNLAIKLVMLLKNMGFDFLCMDNNGAKIETPAGEGKNAAALVSPKRMAELFPGGAGEPVIDQWSMLEPPPKKENVETKPPGLVKSEPFKPVRTGPRSIAINKFKDVPELSGVAKQLRDLAWDLRGKGFEAYFDKETYIEPSGVLAGMFDKPEEAAEYADELKSYGYETKITEAPGADGTQFHVFAQVDELPPQMVTTIDNSGAPIQTTDSNEPLKNLKRPKKASIFPK